jgi:hypothetical protein
VWSSLDYLQRLTAVAALFAAAISLIYAGREFRDSHQQSELNQQGELTDWYSAAADSFVAGHPDPALP